MKLSYYELQDASVSAIEALSVSDIVDAIMLSHPTEERLAKGRHRGANTNKVKKWESIVSMHRKERAV